MLNMVQLQQLIAKVDSGGLIGHAEQISGGFHHSLYKVQTTSGCYAVKQLSAETDIHNPAVVDHFNTTEFIAEQFKAAGISALHALQTEDGYLQIIGHKGYLLYPWCKGQKLQTAQCSEAYALKMASVIAHMHQTKLDIPHVNDPQFELLSDDTLQTLITTASDKGIANAHRLQQQLPCFIEILNKQHLAAPLLEQHKIISHGDLDPKNVLWDDDGEPVLIDWESARYLNPTCEILQAALDWSGIMDNFDQQLCGNFLNAYQQAGGIIEYNIFSAAYDAVVAEWLDWLMFNIARAVDADRSLHTSGNSQIALLLPVLEHLNQLTAEQLLRCDITADNTL